MVDKIPIPIITKTTMPTTTKNIIQPSLENIAIGMRKSERKIIMATVKIRKLRGIFSIQLDSTG
jgi:hypothetical protein